MSELSVDERIDFLTALSQDPPLIPTAYHLLVYVPPVETTTESGIVKMTDREADREQKGSAEGYVIAVGPQAWDELGDGTPWAAVGDRIVFHRYAGTVPEVEGLDSGEFRIMKDDEVLATWPR